MKISSKYRNENKRTSQSKQNFLVFLLQEKKKKNERKLTRKIDL